MMYSKSVEHVNTYGPDAERSATSREQSKIPKRFLIIGIPFLTVSQMLIGKANAHCPLCTAGIAAVAGGAIFLGVKTVVIGLFVGALAISMGFWVGNVRNFVYWKKMILALISYGITVLPLMSLMPGYIPVYISVAGDYGTFLNRTYLFNSFLTGSLIGGIAAITAPWASQKITEIRNGKRIAFQGVIVTFTILIAIGAIMQGLVWEFRM